MNLNLEKLITDSNEILLSEFSMIPVSSIFKLYEKHDWDNFSEINRIPKNALGVYFPRILTANVKLDSKYLPVNFLHEYFGHGLFCEYSLIGKEIVYLEKDLEETEKKILNVNIIPENKHYQIDETNPFFQEYKQKVKKFSEFNSKNIWNYEGFAIWLEYFLSKKKGLITLFEEKMNTDVGKIYLPLFNKFNSFVDTYGKENLFYNLGF
jgi:hypothetical protein